MFGAIAAMLVVSLAAPGAFGTDGVIFGAAYLAVRALHVVLFAKAGHGDRDVLSAVVRLSAAILAPVLLVISGFVHGSGQLALWFAALAILYVGPLVGRMRGFRVSPEHFVERFGLILMIALGESIVAIGVGARGLRLSISVIAAALLGMTVAACLWWSYFDWLIYAGQARLAELRGAERAALARDAYSYLHLPMVGGIVLFAFGLKATLGDVSGSLPTLPALGLFGGIALYLAAHVVLRLRLGGGFGRGRPVATVLLLATFPLGRVLPALASLGLVAAMSVGLIVYEVVAHPASRSYIRTHRGGFTIDDIERVEPRRRRERRPRRRPVGRPSDPSPR